MEFPRHFLLATTGTDGAASAAMILQGNPLARIVITSANALPRTLRSLVDSKAETVSICGVGTADNLGAIVDALETLREMDCTVTWYCGRPYLAPYASMLAAVCTTVFDSSGTNTACVEKALQVPKSKVTERLRRMAAQYVESREKNPEEDQWWHDFVESAAVRLFRYGDTEALPTAIRKLAGLEPVTQGDREQVDLWRSSEAQPLPLGNSPAMKALRKRITRFGPIEEPVLILGPSGSGKELAARSIHEASQRARKPFIPVNCAILAASVDMALDRLFGHVAGAFTDAKEPSEGAFATADGGTLFLDEVAELPLAAQTQLLRVLEESTIMPVGTVKSRRVDVRLIAATNRELPAMVEEGTFRLDLYHRLNVLTLRVPALTDRAEDMGSIARKTIRSLKKKGYSLSLSQDDWDAIHAHAWPGNVREFVNVLKRAAYLGVSVASVLEEEASIQRAPSGDTACPVTLWPAEIDAVRPMAELQQRYIQHVLGLAGNHVPTAAHALGIGMNTVRRWARKK